ncbi:MAG: ADP-ribosylglycohydrolase family protein [Bacteroidota bacterium]
MTSYRLLPFQLSLLFSFLTLCTACQSTISTEKRPAFPKDSLLSYNRYQPQEGDHIISRSDYAEKLYGFWLAQCVANWTGLVTEMDKVGDESTGAFYTREAWGQTDQPDFWSRKVSKLSPIIDFVYAADDSIWGADDDTDIEYMYQHLLYTNQTSVLTPEQIRDGWLKHIKREEENYLWVSNEIAFELMQKGYLPPKTSDPKLNEYYDMIDAQLTTEIFGLFAPGRLDIARKIAQLPIQTTARIQADEIAQFYIDMHALAAVGDSTQSIRDQLWEMAETARKRLQEDHYPAKMYDFVQDLYQQGKSWEEARDAVYQRYQVDQEDGYDMTSRQLPCNACFAAGINYAASLVSLFYGEGDLKETIKIGALCGWDSDNPTATWGGLIGFMIGKEGVEKAFGHTFSNRFHIHRTRINFPEGVDTFEEMAQKGVFIVDRVVQEQMGGGVDLTEDRWYIPSYSLTTTK